MSSPNSEAEGPSNKDWRDELKRRIEAHQQRKEDPHDEGDAPESDSELLRQSPSSGVTLQAPQPEGNPTGSQERHLARNEEELPEEDESPEADSSAAEPADPDEDLRLAGSPIRKPLPVQAPFGNGESDETDAGAIERSVDPADFSADTRQQIVTFSEKASPSAPPLGNEFPSSPPPSAEAAFGGENGTPEEAFPDEGPDSQGAVWISREIFLSRLLAGLVDLLLSSFVGLIFAWLASFLLGFDFFSASTIEISAAGSLLFYLVSSLFFLTLSGQTPGMHLTGLQLLYQESAELPFMAVFIRVLVILPVSASVAGLLWGLFDPWGRCLHDRISQTRVASIPDERGTGPRLELEKHRAHRK